MLTDRVISQAKPKEKLYRISDDIRNGIDPFMLKQQRYPWNSFAREWHDKQKPTWSARHAGDGLKRLDITEALPKIVRKSC